MSHFDELSDTLQQLPDLTPLWEFVKNCSGTLWICGNGGSSAIAQHWAADLTKHTKVQAVALGTNIALLTALSNDISYGVAYAEELTRFAKRGDRLVALSCSGTSPNIVTVLRQTWLLNIPRALLTGAQISITPVDPIVKIPSKDYGVVEDCFSAIGHWLVRELR